MNEDDKYDPEGAKHVFGPFRVNQSDKLCRCVQWGQQRRRTVHSREEHVALICCYIQGIKNLRVTYDLKHLNCDAIANYFRSGS